MAYELCIFLGGDTRRIPLPAPGEYSIGRAEGNAVCIDDPSVSRRHALLTVGERLTIRDLGSFNGTLLGNAHGTRHDVTADVKRLSQTEAELAVGNPVTVGVVMLVVRRTEAARPAEGAAGAPGAVIVDPAMQSLYEQAARAAKSPISVLILGETGVGKEVLARSIHRSSPRSAGPFVSLNCGALAESIIEGELFGHEKGAFTGALQTRPGLFEAADGGTVFLDEVGELPAMTQAKLLRVLEDRTVMRLGGRQSVPIDVRFLSATNRELEAVAASGGFRQDLYFRLNGIALTIPPLRERQSEIEPLVRHFVQAACRAMDRHGPVEVGPEALSLLVRYSYPGNVRELRNVIDRAVVLCQGRTIFPEHLPQALQSARGSSPPKAVPATPLLGDTTEPDDATEALRARVREAERARIAKALADCGGNQTLAAKLLGISRRTLVTRLGELDLPRPRRPRTT